MEEMIKKREADREKSDDCMKPNNPEARRFSDPDDFCHEQIDGK